MNITAFLALVRRDLRLFFLDKRAMTMSFVAPIVIGSFFGYLFGGVTNNRQPSKIAVAAIDLDGSAVSRRVVESLGRERLLDVKAATLDDARAAVRAGKTTVAAVIPAGFGERAVAELVPRTWQARDRVAL